MNQGERARVEERKGREPRGADEMNTSSKRTIRVILAVVVVLTREDTEKEINCQVVYAKERPDGQFDSLSSSGISRSSQHCLEFLVPGREMRSRRSLRH